MRYHVMRFNFPLFCLIIVLAGCIKPEQSQSEFVLATVCNITLFDKGKPQVYRDIFRRLREIESLMSAHLEGSDVDRINKSAGLEAVEVHRDVFFVIEQALHYAELSDGAFDPTVGPLVSLWNISGEDPKVPSQEEIERVLPLVNWRDLELDRDTCSVFLKRPGMALDLGGIAKGYAADEAAAIIKKAGIPRAIIDLGGNILLVGEKKDKGPWRVGIQDPFERPGNYIGIVQTGENSVVTSGVYERYFEADGVKYHHILSPRDGYPVRNELLSATIITGISIAADAMSTATFVLGYEKGSSLVESLEGLDAIFVFTDKSTRAGSGANFTPSDIPYSR